MDASTFLNLRLGFVHSYFKEKVERNRNNPTVATSTTYKDHILTNNKCIRTIQIFV